MSSSGWQRRLIPLTKGEHDENTANVGEVGITSAFNCEFGIHGAVRGRPSMNRVTGFLTRDLDSSNKPFPQQHLTQQTATTNPPMAMFGVKDGNGERPALLTTGKLWTMEPFANNSVPWTDRLGCSPTVSRRRHSAYQLPDTVISGYGLQPVPVAPTFMPAPLNNNFIITSGLNGGITTTYDISSALAGPGTSARCGTKDAVLYTENNNLVIVTSDITSPGPVRTVLAADAATVTGYGDAPCICCDFDATVFYVIYRTTTAHTYKVLSVTTGGTPTVLVTATFGAGILKNVWITNTNVATNRLVIAVNDTVSPGVSSRVLNATTGASLGIDVNLNANLGIAGAAGFNKTSVTLGVAANGVCWFTGLGILGGPSRFFIGTRSLTTATSTVYYTVDGENRGFYVTPEGGFGTVSVSNQGPDFFLLHQPVLVNNRVIVGLVGISRWTQIINGANVPPGNYNQLGTWYCYDVTDLHIPGAGVGSGTLLHPVLAAMGPSEGTQVPWQCPGAVVIQESTNFGNRPTITFPTIDWSRFNATVITPGDQITNAGTATIAQIYDDIAGHDGQLGLNSVYFQAPSVSNFGESTIIGGSAPRQIAGDYCFPVGFPFLGRPSLSITGSALTGASPSSQNFVAVWKYIDARGQIHRSMPSPEIKVAGNSGGITFSMVINNPPIAERESQLFLELYATQPIPAAGAPHYLWSNPGSTTGGTPFAVTNFNGGQQSFAFNGLFSGALIATEPTLYTDGNTFSNEVIGGSGGLVSLGNRIWMSDGTKVYASKLGQDGEGPAWNSDGPLTLDIPASAGFILNLARLDDKIVILCERGIWLTTGSGPDDTGQGPQFAIPVQYSDVATQPGRTVVSTPRGIVFIGAAANDGQALSTGPWLFGRDLILTNLASRTQFTVELDASSQLAWFPEREWIAWCMDDGLLIVWDVRTDNWSIWQPSSTSSDIIVGIVGAAAGCLWTDGIEPSQWISTNGQDFDGTFHNFPMTIITNNIPVVENDRTGWGHVRCIKILGETGSHTLTWTAKQDDLFFTTNSLVIAMSGGATWPAPSRYLPEIRLARSKCSVISLQLTASPASATWVALEIQTRPLSAGAPSAQRQ